MGQKGQTMDKRNNARVMGALKCFSCNKMILKHLDFDLLLWMLSVVSDPSPSILSSCCLFFIFSTSYVKIKRFTKNLAIIII